MAQLWAREDTSWPTDGQPLGCPVECMSTELGGWEMDCD